MKPKILIPTLVIIAVGLAAIGIVANMNTETPQAAVAGEKGHSHMHGGTASCGEVMCEKKECCSESGKCCGSKGEKDAMTEVPGQEALAMMNFTLTGNDGKEYQLSDYAGKIVVLEWFNHSCPFVVPHYEKGTMTSLANKYSDEGVVWMAVNSTITAPLSIDKEFAEEYDIPYPILNDRSGKVGRMFGATNTPQIYVINPKGQIVYNGPIDNAHRGVAPDQYTPYVDNVLAKLTSGEPVTATTIKPVGCTVKYPK